MEIKRYLPGEGFDRTNAIIAGLVFLFSFVIYRMTVAPTLSFWDCGEFIACAYTLGVPHPPGWPLFVVLGRVISVLPIAADISFRINMLSVIGSAFVAFFGYLSVVRMIKYWYANTEFDGWKRVIAYLGGTIGAFFMAFSASHWGNAVEAEVFGISMMLMTMILWLLLLYYEHRDTPKGNRIIILACYLGMLSVAAHLATFLIIPVAAIFFILKKDAPPRAWVAICAFFVAELLAIIMVSNGRGGFPAFIALSIIFLTIVAIMVYRHINWPILIGIAAFSMIMIGFYEFLFGIIGGSLVLLLAAYFFRQSEWRTGIIIILVAVIGFSFHLLIPIRSALDPEIDMNKTSRSFKSFVDFLDRKQYGRQSMVDRMFERRGTWSHQFGRHANMGFWSYFEDQYSNPKVFGLLFLMGLFGVVFMIRKKMEIGLPFLIFLLLATVGLVLYMNFADGIKYNERTGDAYLEVRNRDYFFTPAFIYFGLAIGIGAAALMEWVRAKTASARPAAYQRPAMLAMSLMIFLPSLALAHNYFTNDRSRNYYPYIYAYNILQTCEKDAILFTSGDNDTFPLWCVQAVYGLRKDVHVVNLSLFNTDWYVAQMKDHGVPLSLTDDQIYWYPFDYDGEEIMRPKETFYDRPRKRKTYLIPLPYEGRVMKLQDMLMDDVVLTNNWKNPVYFSSEPYAESPLKLRDLSIADGMLYKMVKNPPGRKIDVESGHRLFTEVYKYDGLNDPTIFRDENASGVMLTLGFNALRIYDEFQRTGQKERGLEMLHFIVDKYPEFFQAYVTLSQEYKKDGDTAKADSVLAGMERTLADLHRRNPSSLFYIQDLGLAKYYRGDVEGGLALLWEAFDANPNSAYAYRKLMQVLFDTKRSSEIIKATQMYAAYKINLSDPLVRSVLDMSQPPAPQGAPGGEIPTGP